MPKCLVVQHLAPEAPFAAEDALRLAGVKVEKRLVHRGQKIPPTIDGFDGLIVMGGPMSATSDDGFQTRCDEIALLADAIRVGVPTLGICLGAQLLAIAAGASVSKGGAGPEIGWSEVCLRPEAETDPLFAGIEDPVTVLQWHSDTFDLPTAAAWLATAPVYPNQAFRVAERSWGLQFHLEVTEDAVEGFLRCFGQELSDVPGGAEKIRYEMPAALAQASWVRDLVFRRFADLVGSMPGPEADLPSSARQV